MAIKFHWTCCLPLTKPTPIVADVEPFHNNLWAQETSRSVTAIDAACTVHNGRPSVCPSVPSSDSSNGGPRVCCWALCGQDISGTMQQACRRSAANACSVTVTADLLNCHSLQMSLERSCCKIVTTALPSARPFSSCCTCLSKTLRTFILPGLYLATCETNKLLINYILPICAHYM